MSRSVKTTAVLLALLALTACGTDQKVRPVADDEYQDYRTKNSDKGKLFGDQGLAFGVGKGAKADDSAGAGLGLNAFLWRGALNTLAFMPLTSADPFGGVIITDWYQPPQGSGERFKATAYILGRQLRADGVKLTVFRQVARNGQWVDAPISPVTTSEIENKVLARARELRSQVASN